MSSQLPLFSDWVGSGFSFCFMWPCIEVYMCRFGFWYFWTTRLSPDTLSNLGRRVSWPRTQVTQTEILFGDWRDLKGQPSLQQLFFFVRFIASGNHHQAALRPSTSVLLFPPTAALDWSGPYYGSNQGRERSFHWRITVLLTLSTQPREKLKDNSSQLKALHEPYLNPSKQTWRNGCCNLVNIWCSLVF